MTEKPLTIDELNSKFKEELKKINEVDLYFSLKMRKLIVMKTELNVLKVVIVLYKLGLPINTALVSYYNCNSVGNTLKSLHKLGDRKLIVLKRCYDYGGRGNPYEWVISPLFKKIITEKKI